MSRTFAASAASRGTRVMAQCWRVPAVSMR
jgi:hypothetical protein